MNLDDLVLSGALFSNSRSASPVRSPSRSQSASPDPLFPSNNDFTDSDVSISPSGSTSNLRGAPAETHMRQGRTGVKGVIRDHNEAVGLQKAKHAQEIQEANRRMEKMALTARTYAEDEEDRLREKTREEGSGASAMIERRMFKRADQSGHLREVGEAGFLKAIDGEMDGTWVVLHIYDPSLARCHDVDSVLARLARQYPMTKFLRARAAAVGFASLTTPRSSSGTNTNLITFSENASYPDEEEDLYFNDDEEGKEEEVVTDLDVLPTLLVYRAGEIVHNWIRVDWEAEAWGKRGDTSAETNGSSVEALLRGHNIIQSMSNGNCGFSSDDEDTALEFVQEGFADDDEVFDL